MDVELACPQCRKAIIISLARMSAGNTLECTTCGGVIRFDDAPDLMAADRAIEDLKKLATPAPLTAGKVERPWWKFWGA